MTTKHHNPVEHRLNQASRRGIVCTRSSGMRTADNPTLGFYGSNRTPHQEVEQSSEA